MDLSPGTCSVCKTEQKILPSKDAAEFTAYIASAFFSAENDKSDEFTKHKKNVKLCVHCAFKLEKSHKFREQCEETAQQSKRRSSTECFLCDGCDFKLVKADAFVKQIKVFGAVANTPTMVKQRVICLQCVFELDLWSEMEQIVSKMFEFSEPDKKRQKINTLTAQNSPQNKNKTPDRQSRKSPRPKDKSLLNASTPTTSDEDKTGRSKSVSPVRGKTFFKINLGRKTKSMSDSKPKYFCTTCKKPFTFLHHYNKHMQCHQKQKQKSVVVNLLRYKLPKRAKVSEFLKEENKVDKRTRRNLNRSKEDTDDKKTPARKSPAFKRKRENNESKEEINGSRSSKRIKLKESNLEGSDNVSRKKDSKIKGTPKRRLVLKGRDSEESSSEGSDRDADKSKKADDDKRKKKKTVARSKQEKKFEELNGMDVDESEDERKGREEQNETRRTSRSPKKVKFAAKEVVLPDDESHSATDEEKPSTSRSPRRVRFADEKIAPEWVIDVMKYDLPATINVTKFFAQYPDKFSKEHKSKSMADALLKKYVGEENLISLGLQSYVQESEKMDVAEENNEKIESELETNQDDTNEEVDENGKVTENQENEETESTTLIDETEKVAVVTEEEEPEVSSEESAAVEDKETPTENETSREENEPTENETNREENELTENETSREENEPTENEANREENDSPTEQEEKSEDDSSDVQKESQSGNEEDTLRDSQKEDDTPTPIDNQEEPEESVQNKDTVPELEDMPDFIENSVSVSEEVVTSASEEIVTTSASDVQLVEQNEVPDILEATADEEPADSTNGIEANGLADKPVEFIEDISSISNFIRETMNSPLEQDSKRKSDESPLKKKVRFAVDPEEQDNDFSLMLSNG